MKRVFAIILTTFLITTGAVLPSHAASDAVNGYNTLAVAKNNAGQATPLNDANLRKLAQERAESLAKQDKPVAEAKVDSGVTAVLRNQGFGATYQLKGRNSGGSANVVQGFLETKRAHVLNPSYNALGVGVALSKSNYTYVVALYANFEKPVIAKPKPVEPPKPKAPAKKPAVQPVVPAKKPVAKPTVKPVEPVEQPKPVEKKPSTPTTKPTTAPVETPRPEPSDDKQLKSAEERAKKAEAAAEQQRASAEKNKTDAEKAVKEATEHALSSEAKRLQKEKAEIELKSTVRMLTGQVLNASVAIGALLFAATFFMRRKRLLPLPQWPTDDRDND